MITFPNVLYKLRAELATPNFGTSLCFRKCLRATRFHWLQKKIEGRAGDLLLLNFLRPYDLWKVLTTNSENVLNFLFNYSICHLASASRHVCTLSSTKWISMCSLRFDEFWTTTFQLPVLSITEHLKHLDYWIIGSIRWTTIFELPP